MGTGDDHSVSAPGFRIMKLAITTRHRVLATILQRVSAPLKKADLRAVAHYLIGHLSYSQVPALAKRHKIDAKKDSASAQELLAKQVGTYDEAELCKLLLEISLLDSAYQRSTASRDDVLADAAKRYRVDAEKLQKAWQKNLLRSEIRRRRLKQSRRPAKRRHKSVTLRFLAECEIALRHFLGFKAVG